jgi:hypothetical protein
MTPAQLAALKADILSDPAFTGLPANLDGAYEISAAYAVVVAVDVWRTDANVAAIYDAIDWTKYTPTDAPDGSAIYTNRVLAVQTKQINLQNMLQGRQTVDASLAHIRSGLRDAVIALPTGAGGAATSAGGPSGATVVSALTRKANRGEALFAAGPVQTGTVSAKILAFEGTLTPEQVQQARELP